ncbi:MAG: hypothetical protein HKN99_10870 [Winogradskyella sp.]|nr:hypothetical protein [Winogradskyella sp.]MBT8375572.1 hypothetical protein [Bacteroidia bacterium]NNC46373.1 hypothetical protein [Winogradskyella sp.]NNF86236.1 hypothetical protein [Winogradskyella sp.]NNK39924.1 hypothetical protein [Winogradskyella sp.]
MKKIIKKFRFVLDKETYLNADTHYGILDTNEQTAAQRLLLNLIGWSLTLVVLTIVLLIWFSIK